MENQIENNPNEQRFLSEDAIILMSMLPKGLTEEWQEKSFKVFARTKEELAAKDLLQTLLSIKNHIESGLIQLESSGYLKQKIDDAIEKAKK